MRSVVLLLLVFVVGCSSSSAATSAPSPTPAPAAATPLVLTIWHSWSGRSAQTLDLLARRYEQSHPDVRIVLQSHPASSFVRDYSTSVADGSAPQMILVLSRYVGDLASRSQILPLEDRFTPESLQPVLPAALDSVRIGGQLQAIPIVQDSLVLFYNRRTFAEPPASFETLLASAEGTNDSPADPRPALAYYLSAATTLPYLQAFEGAIFDGSGRSVLDDTTPTYTGTVRWLEWLQGLQADERAMATDDYGAVDAMIQANRVSAVIDWNHRLGDYQQLWGRDAVGIAALPRVDGTNAAPSLVLTDALCINPITTAQQRSAASDFMRFMLGTEAQALLWSRGMEIPVNTSADVDRAAQDLLRVASDGLAFPNTARMLVAWPLLDSMVRGVLSGSATPVEAIDTANQGLQTIKPTP